MEVSERLIAHAQRHGARAACALNALGGRGNTALHLRSLRFDHLLKVPRRWLGALALNPGNPWTGPCCVWADASQANAANATNPTTLNSIGFELVRMPHLLQIFDDATLTVSHTQV
jgi:hypothetical protein